MVFFDTQEMTHNSAAAMFTYQYRCSKIITEIAGGEVIKVARARSICYHKDVILRPENTLREVVETLSATRLDAVPVVDPENRVLGVMTKYNLYKALLRGVSLDTPIAGIYACPAITANNEQVFGEVYEFMVGKNLGQVVVIDSENRPMGMLTKLSIIEALLIFCCWVKVGRVKRCLVEAEGNRSRVARILGISRTKLYEKLRKYAISSKQ